ncbi:DUF397 domain-containing protein [Streptomyces sp. NPDC002324]
MNHGPHWQRSTFSGGGEGNTCLELTSIATHMLGLRESDTPTTVIATTRTPLAHLLHAITAGRLTPPRG